METVFQNQPMLMEKGDDFIDIYGYPYRYHGNTTVTAIGGIGNDTISVTKSDANVNTTFTSVSVDGGDGNDKITVAGALITPKHRLWQDTIVLTAAQYQQLLAESINIFDRDGNTSVTPEPFTITDFSTGIGGDLIDYGDLLRNAATAYDGSNPFSTGFLSLTQNGSDTLLSFDRDGSAGSSKHPPSLPSLKTQ